MPDSQQVALCLADTNPEDLAATALSVQELLQMLAHSAAEQQIVWLDACHSGGMTFLGTRTGKDPQPLANPSPQLIRALRQRAAQSKGFYALLSCDQGQPAWEFPELGHGVFTYFLMRGLRGEAADAQGIIKADALYRYVYHQTLHYIDQANQHLRLVNQQKRSRGETHLHPEYPLQTPKRIVEGVGEFILGMKPVAAALEPQRRSLILDGLWHCQPALELGKILQGAGDFTTRYWPNPSGTTLADVQAFIQTGLGESATVDPPETVLLYLRAYLAETAAGEPIFRMEGGIRLSGTWLQQQLQHCPAKQQIVILDCPQPLSEGTSSDSVTLLKRYFAELQPEHHTACCLLATTSPSNDPEQFVQALFQTLTQVEPGAGLTAAHWIGQLRAALGSQAPDLQAWVSGAQGILNILPVNLQPTVVLQTLDIGLCPYLGLNAFSEVDAAYFYGRESLTQDLVQRLTTQSFLAIVGASGSGKSSLVQAGVLRSLKQGQMVASTAWAIRTMRPGARPLEALARAWVDPGMEAEQAMQQSQLEGILYQGIESFVYWLRQRPEPLLMLVVDQFEELFTQAAAAERTQFVDLLLGAVAHAGDRFKLVITVRADFMTASLAMPTLAQAIQQSSVFIPSSLSEEEYRQIILKPAQQVGLQVEPELVEVLLQDLQQSAGELPLLEFVLQQLWEHRKEGKLTLNAYLHQIGGLKGALERSCQSVYESLDADMQHCAQWIFLTLTHIGEGNHYTRRRVPKSALVVAKYPAPLVEQTLQALVAAKLVMIDFEGGDLSFATARHVGDTTDPADEPLHFLQEAVTVEVTHEILIRHWSTLQWWLEENRTLLQRQRQLADAAQLWQQNGQQAEFLLQGIRLAEAEDLYIKHTDELSAETHRFLAACLDAQQAQQQLTQRRLRRAQITALVMAGLGVTAFGFGSLAFWQKQTAQARAIEALNASADAQMLSHRQLEALVLSVKGGQQLQQMVGAPTALQRATLGQLEKVLQSTQEINRLEGHQGAVTDITYHPQGQSFASVSEDHHVKLWSKDGALLKIFPGKGGNITRIRFRPDGQQLAIATANGILQIWDGAGAVRRSFQGHQGYITSLAVNPNGQTFVSAGDDRTIKLWNWQGKLLKTYRGHTDGVSSLSFSPDGQMLASASWDKTIQLWSMKGQHLKTLKGHRDEVTEVVFSPDGQSLASASADRTIKLWQVADGTVETMTRKARGSHSHRDRINSIQFSPDGKRLASASADGTIGVWRRGGHLLETLNGPGAAVNQVVFSPDGRTLASVSADTSIRLWQVKGKAAAPVSDLQTLLRQSCHHLQTYLTTNPRVSSSDRNLCD
jgi:energy-coupling factor transporter ATP-binding protein EcfA2/sugar lactone lactonase YvrE